MEEEYLDFELGGIKMKVKPTVLEDLIRAHEDFQAHLAALGQLSWAFAGLDHSVDRLFEPLLQCSSKQVACIVVENVSTRCSQLIHLLHLNRKPSVFRDWVEGLLKRVSGELGPERNRYMHDRWVMHWTPTNQRVTRTSKRPSLNKAQSRAVRTLNFDRQQVITITEMLNLSYRMNTVSEALKHATQSLQIAQQKGRLPKLHPQWLPASKQKALAHWDEARIGENSKQPPPTRYEFD